MSPCARRRACTVPTWVANRLRDELLRLGALHAGLLHQVDAVDRGAAGDVHALAASGGLDDDCGAAPGGWVGGQREAASAILPGARHGASMPQALSRPAPKIPSSVETGGSQGGPRGYGCLVQNRKPMKCAALQPSMQASRTSRIVHCAKRHGSLTCIARHDASRVNKVIDPDRSPRRAGAVGGALKHTHQCAAEGCVGLSGACSCAGTARGPSRPALRMCHMTATTETRWRWEQVRTTTRVCRIARRRQQKRGETTAAGRGHG